MADVTEPKWLEQARLHLGVKEHKGTRHNPAVLEFFRAVGHPEIDTDETAWCAAFVGAMLKTAGYPTTPVPVNLAARSYQQYGKPLSEPRIGCIAVFKRGNSSWMGHVGFVVGWDDDSIELLGGNQNNSVNIAKFSRMQLLALRWPVAADAKELEAAGSTEIKLAKQLKRVAVGVGTGAATIKTVTEVGVVEQAKEVTEGLGVGKGLLEGLQAVLTLITSNGLLFVTALAIGGWFLARHIAMKRIERHARGIALSPTYDPNY